MPQHKFRVWLADEHEYDGSAKEYTVYEPREAVLKHADHYHSHRDGWEASWPIDFIVRDLGEKYPYDADGTLYKFDVDRETVPHFVTSYKDAEQLKIAPGVHDRMIDGEYVCTCCHPTAFAGECTKCLCATGKRFYTMDDGGASYSFVARDVDHCKQLLRDVGVVLTKDDGDEGSIDDPEFADLEWRELTQEEATRLKCHPDDGGKPAQPLTTYELGAWFCSDY